MKKLHFPLGVLALGLILSANTCADKGTDGSAAMTPEGKWVLVSLNGTEVQMPEGVETPYISVDSTGENVTGFAGCNRMFGTVKTWGDSISFPGLAATRMYCVETQAVENSFMEALNTTRTYSVKGDELELRGDGGATLLRRSDQ